MMVGLDVMHRCSSREDAPSIVGIVSAIDRYFVRFPADTRFRTSRQELVQTPKELMEGKVVLRSKDDDGALPQAIHLCRDGVSVGQYNLVLDLGLPLIQDACQEMLLHVRARRISHA
jgi:hypothetical protein